MNQSNLTIGGAVVYWRLAPATSLPKLAEGMAMPYRSPSINSADPS